MLTEYKIVYAGGEGEITEKKSRFIATVVPVDNEEEALAFIESMRKKYWNATHNCFAYAIGERREVLRCSDDGEPSGTAGKPMLDVLAGEELHNVAVVVTRYFGGTLLGTGGLVRAYVSATQAGLAASKIITKRFGFKLKITTDYTGLGRIQYILGEKKIKILDSEYTDQVMLQTLIPSDMIKEIQKELAEGTSGRAVMEVGEELWYGEIDGELKILEEK